MQLERQPDSLPTNKSLVLGLFIVLSYYIEPAVAEVWPTVAPSQWAGPNLTTLIAAIIGYVIAWFVPDRAGTPV